MKPIFSAEDFRFLDHNNYISPAGRAATLAQEKIQKLIESWPVVIGAPDDQEVDHWSPSLYNYPGATHKARLAFIEELPKKECLNHSPTVAAQNVSERNPDIAYMLGCSVKCSICGAKLKATWSVDE